MSNRTAPNLFTMVRAIMEISKQKVDQPDLRQTALYVGFCCEELGEVMAAIAGGCIAQADKMTLLSAADYLTRLATRFKAGAHQGDIGRCDLAELLDGLIDVSWVGAGAAYSISTDAGAALEEVCRANSDKFPGGVGQLDANGKWIKPHGWRGPDLSPFVVPMTV